MKIKKVLFLGPAGTYSDLAKNKFVEYFGIQAEVFSVDSISKIIRLLKEENSPSLAAVVPIENSVEGVVRETLDNLSVLASGGIKILSETTLEIRHALAGYASSKSEIKTIISHPQALAQCREYIYRNWGENITLNPVLSTSQGTNTVTPDNTSAAVICSEYCSKIYGVPVIDSGINDEDNNTTRFVLLGKSSMQKSGNDKVSITFSTENKPGSLNNILTILKKYNLNMSYIDSRPSRKQLGEYVFYIDFAGHVSDMNVSSALEEIRPYLTMFSLLSEGAYII